MPETSVLRRRKNWQLLCLLPSSNHAAATGSTEEAFLGSKGGIGNTMSPLMVPWRRETDILVKSCRTYLEAQQEHEAGKSPQR